MIEPHGGILVDKIADESEKKMLEEKVPNLYGLVIENRYITDCEMIAIGGFSPLKGFMRKETVESVLERMELPDGTLWSIPIILPIPEEKTAEIAVGDEVVLKDSMDRPIAIIEVSEKFTIDKSYYCQKVFKTTDLAHPGVKSIVDSGDICIAGEITLINTPLRRNIDERYFLDPTQTREEFKKRGWRNVVAFQTRNPIHRAHEYLIKCALETVDGVLIHPLVGETKPDDIPADVRMKCYEVLINNYFNKEHVLLSVLPAAMRYAGPREAIHHMIMRKNYGCTHMIIGRDHAGVGNYYGTYEAQEIVEVYTDRLGIKPIKFEHAFYCTKCGNMTSQKTCPHPKEAHLHLSGTKVRAMLREGQHLPENFTRPEVAEVLLEWAKNCGL